MRPPITDEEKEIIRLIGVGFTRWKIARQLDLSESSVRLIIRRLCTEYGCAMRDLPEAVGGTREKS
jgi:DNA-binding CsgD family transcriptional regulator